MRQRFRFRVWSNYRGRFVWYVRSSIWTHVGGRAILCFELEEENDRG